VQESSFGSLLRAWRQTRKMSQLDLALAAEVSARHLSFLETGRSQPSRDMVLALADVLEVPLRERNAMLTAAGFAHGYRESDLDAPEMAPVKRALEFLLAHHDPYPAVVCDRAWDVRLQNAAATRLMLALIEPAHLAAPVNAMRTLFDPRGLRPYIVNWDELAAVMVQRLHREALARPDDADAAALLAFALAGDIPTGWRTLDLGAVPAPIVPIHLRKGGLELRLFSALTSLGTPVDVTAQELRIETFFAADEATDARLRAVC
jgi:transcriptional regulator with XRE-family HTH domain